MPRSRRERAQLIAKVERCLGLRAPDGRRGLQGFATRINEGLDVGLGHPPLVADLVAGNLAAIESPLQPALGVGNEIVSVAADLRIALGRALSASGGVSGPFERPIILCRSQVCGCNVNAITSGLMPSLRGFPTLRRSAPQRTVRLLPKALTGCRCSCHYLYPPGYGLPRLVSRMGSATYRRQAITPVQTR